MQNNSFIPAHFPYCESSTSAALWGFGLTDLNLLQSQHTHTSMLRIHLHSARKYNSYNCMTQTILMLLVKLKVGILNKISIGTKYNWPWMNEMDNSTMSHYEKWVPGMLKETSSNFKTSHFLCSISHHYATDLYNIISCVRIMTIWARKAEWLMCVCVGGWH